VNLLVIPVVSSFVIVGIIIYLFIITNPVDSQITVVNYPYTISVKPQILDTQGMVHMYFSIYESALIKLKPQDMKLLLVDPKGVIFTKNLNPTDFVLELNVPNEFPNSQLFPGKYSILLLYKGINQNVTTSFEVLSYNPYISSLFSFLIKDGQTLTIGLMIAVITAIYQFLTTKNEDRKRIVNDKAEWMRDKASEYSSLYSNSIAITSYFNVSRLKNGHQVILEELGKEKRLLYDILDFYRAYVRFYESGIDYYFDDYSSEDFLDCVWTEIRGLYSEILTSSTTPLSADELKQPDYLKKFFVDASGKQKYYYDLENDKEFSTFAGYLVNWLCRYGDDQEYPNIKKLYSYHFVYANVILLMIEGGLLVSYSKAKNVEEEIRLRFEENYDELSEYIDYLNPKIYEKKQNLYFTLKLNDKHLKRRKWWQWFTRFKP
jgi:hypothetical protein